MTKIARWLAPALVAGLTLAGCSTSDPAPSVDAGTSTTTAKAGGTSSTKAPDGTAAPKKVEIKTATSKIGEILVDGEGMTLYLYADDTATTLACDDTCAIPGWPPVVGTVEAGSSLDAASFATVTRPKGVEQVTYKGHPLYLFAGDEKAGDLNGQTVIGKWFVVGVDGNAIETKP